MEKRFVAGVISPVLSGNMNWTAREIRRLGTADHSQQGPCAVQTDPSYVWRCGGDEGLDVSTGEPYDVRNRPWYRHAVEQGAGFTEPYADPVTGEGMVSYVIPLYADEDQSESSAVVGVVIAGSFLDSRGDFW